MESSCSWASFSIFPASTRYTESLLALSFPLISGVVFSRTNLNSVSCRVGMPRLRSQLTSSRRQRPRYAMDKKLPVNYAFRLSGPVTALTARRVRWRRSRPHLPASPTTLSLAFVPFLPFLFLTFLHRSLMPRTALSSTYSLPGPLVLAELIRRGQREKCRSATAGSHSLDASAVLSRRPSDACVDS
jgi:hypothetical protein